MEKKDKVKKRIRSWREERKVNIERKKEIKEKKKRVGIVVVEEEIGEGENRNKIKRIWNMVVEIEKRGRNIVGKSEGKDNKVGMKRWGERRNEEELGIVERNGNVNNLKREEWKKEGNKNKREGERKGNKGIGRCKDEEIIGKIEVKIIEKWIVR